MAKNFFGILSTAARKAIDFNCSVSAWQSQLAARILPRPSGRTEFYDKVLPSLLQPGARVLDVGGGKRPAIDVSTKRRLGLYVVGLDVSSDELAGAPAGAYDDTIVGDISTCAIQGEFDVILSVTLIEHICDVRAAMKNMKGALAEGGVMAHYVPCRNALFAVLNRLVGNKLGKRLLYLLHPRLKKTAGFKAYYDCCTPNQLQKICRQIDLNVQQVHPYYVSEYFSFFVPAHTLDLLRQLAIQLLRAREFAETFTVVATQPLEKAKPKPPKYLHSDRSQILNSNQ